MIMFIIEDVSLSEDIYYEATEKFVETYLNVF